MALYDKTGAALPQTADILLDTVYTAPAQNDIACFLQDGDQRLDFIRPVKPLDGETAVARREDVVAHLLGDYGDESSIEMTMNTEVLDVTIAASVDGVLVSRNVAERDLEPDDTSGDCELHVEGIEAVAGAQTEDWAFGLKAKPRVTSFAAAKVRIRPEVLGPTAGVVRIRLETVGRFAAAVHHRLQDQLIGRAAGRIFVGEFFVDGDGSLTATLAEEDLDDQGSLTGVIRGFRLQHDGSMTVELRGPRVNDRGSLTANVVAVFLNDDGSLTANVAFEDLKDIVSVTGELWGVQTGDPYGKLVIRVSSLPAAVKAALEAHGIKFS